MERNFMGEEERLAGAETAAAQGEDGATQPTNEEETKGEGEGEEDKEDFETNWHQGVESFDDMGLREDILRGIYSYGFKEPSKIQQKGILPVIQGRDTIA
jgi:superfamily II DNA/RNA helicase